MTVFSWMKQNKMIRWTALAAYWGILVLSSIHTHPVHTVFVSRSEAVAWNASPSCAANCEDSHSHEHCALCDAISLANSCIPTNGLEIAGWTDIPQNIGNRYEVILPGHSIQFLSRAPPSLSSTRF